MKKNTFKKLMSAVLSVAMLASMMIIPANAVVPGEDAYSGNGLDENYVYVDYENKSSTIVSKADIPTFTGTSTYDLLNPTDKTRMEKLNARVAKEHAAMEYQENYQTYGVDDGNFSFYQSSGVVIIGVFDSNGNYLTHGSGFMLNDDTFLTAAHVIFGQDSTYQIPASDADLDIRVFFDINVDIGNALDDESVMETVKNWLKSRNSSFYTQVSRGCYSTALVTGTEDYEYDWYLGKLATPVSENENIFYFPCAVPTTAYETRTSYVLGYPGEYSLQMVRTVGTIIEVDDPYTQSPSNPFDNAVRITNEGSGGMSGGPMYVLVGNYIQVCGINSGKRGTNASNFSTCATMIFPDLMNVITDFME